MNDWTFTVFVLAGPVGFLAITAPHIFDPPPPGLAGWIPHIAMGLLALWAAARWINTHNNEE